MSQEITTVECILRITNPTNFFNKDLKVNINQDLLEDDSWEYEDIYSGASQTLLQKYLPQMKEQGAQIYLLKPMELIKDKFTEFLEDADTNKAKADIDAILSALPEEKRMKVLNQLNR